MAKQRGITKERIAQLVEHVAGGGSVLAWCRAQGIADESTAYRALQRHEMAQEFARARLNGAQRLADEALAIVDGATPDDPQDVARRKLRAETRLKLAACYAPAVFGLSRQNASGASISVTIATGVPESPQAQRITVTNVERPKLGSGDDATGDEGDG